MADLGSVIPVLGPTLATRMYEINLYMFFQSHVDIWNLELKSNDLE